MASVQRATAQTRGLVCYDLLYSTNNSLSFVFHPSPQSFLHPTFVEARSLQHISREDVTKQTSQRAFISGPATATLLFDVTYFLFFVCVVTPAAPLPKK